MTESEYNAIVRSMRSQRILSEADVEKATRRHDKDDFTALERGAQFGV